MFDVIRKAMYAGVGLAAMSMDKVEEMAREIAKTADLSEKKGEEFVNEMMGKSEEMRADLEQTIQSVVHETLKQLDVPTREEVAELNAKLAQLEQRLNG